MEKCESKEKKPIPSSVYGLLLVAECMIWGFSNAFSKLGLDEITPVWCLVFRYFASFWLFIAVFGKRFRRNFKKSDLKPCAIVSVFTAAAFILGFMGLAYTSATNCGFLMSLAVVFAPLLSVPLLKMKFQPRMLIPVLIASAGLFCFSGGSLTSLATGDILAILCSVASAFMLVTSSKYLHEVDAIVLSVIQCAVCFIVCLITALIIEPLPDVASFSPIVWYVIAFLVVGCTFLAYYFQNTALSHVSPTFGAMVFCTEPIFTAITAYFMLGERLNLLGIIGAVLIVGGISLASIFEGLTSKPKAEKSVSAE